MIRILVCGGRDFSDAARMTAVLDDLRQRRGIGKIIAGDARGADALARRYAKRRGIPVAIYEAEWALHGPAAGPIRNRRMLQEADPDVVVAFPGGRGTRDMVEQANAAGIEVIQVALERGSAQPRR